MELNELRSRIAQLNPQLSANAVALLQLAAKLFAEGKVKSSVMQNEIPRLLENVERSEELQRKIERRRFFLQFGRLINSVSKTKLKLPDDTHLNGQAKAEVDEKISSLVSTINKILREDGPLDVDFKYQVMPDGVKILSYVGATFDVLKIPETIEGRPIISIGERAFQGNELRAVQFPTNLFELGEGAFQNCKNLASVTLPPHLINISDSCFENCASLTGINFNDELRSIGNSAFRGTAVKRIIFPKSVRFIGDDAFMTPAQIKALFEVDDATFYVSDSAFETTATLYYRHDKIEEALKKTKAAVSGNVAEFFGDSSGAVIYKIRLAVKNIFIFIVGLTALVVMGLFNFIRTPVGLGAAGVAAIYFGGNFVYDKFFVEKDELISEVGSVAVQLNDQKGVDQTVVAYNSIVQGLYDAALKEDADRAKVFGGIFVKSCVLEETDQTSAYYYATLNTDDYICFQANPDGYISAAYIWIDENHTDIIMPVLAITLHTVTNVSLDQEFSKQIIDKLAEEGGNVMFHSLQAGRDFKVAAAKKGDKYQYTIQAFTD